MRKQMSYINYWVEVAPSPLISPNRASNAPKLETIAEEGPEKIIFVSSKKAIYVLPVILSVVSYLLMNRLSII
ncbi:hypothetical protein CDL12_04840 [Handroanthus impetiginosus]|uniref:Uncharacterized protein n=1 Tax=Handroanthus impetiginosus TaxID=429701 RepID=A0A2G9HY41_9LAMI|nr:hypothetical protein CDL12_04840 [Handroanthus impetiginosus]